jgi:hypothetical protein
MKNILVHIEQKEIYDSLGFPLPPDKTEGYDLNGFPVMRQEVIIIEEKNNEKKTK